MTIEAWAALALWLIAIGIAGVSDSIRAVARAIENKDR